MSVFPREHDTNKQIILCKNIHYIPRLVRMISDLLCLVAIWKHTFLRICLGVSSLALGTPGSDDDDDDDDYDNDNYNDNNNSDDDNNDDNNNNK